MNQTGAQKQNTITYVEEPDKSEFGGACRSEVTGDVILYRTRSPNGETTDKSEFKEFK